MLLRTSMASKTAHGSRIIHSRAPIRLLDTTRTNSAGIIPRRRKNRASGGGAVVCRCSAPSHPDQATRTSPARDCCCCSGVLVYPNYQLGSSSRLRRSDPSITLPNPLRVPIPIFLFSSAPETRSRVSRPPPRPRAGHTGRSSFFLGDAASRRRSVQVGGGRPSRFRVLLGSTHQRPASLPLFTSSVVGSEGRCRRRRSEEAANRRRRQSIPLLFSSARRSPPLRLVRTAASSQWFKDWIFLPCVLLGFTTLPC